MLRFQTNSLLCTVCMFGLMADNHIWVSAFMSHPFWRNEVIHAFWTEERQPGTWEGNRRPPTPRDCSVLCSLYGYVCQSRRYSAHRFGSGGRGKPSARQPRLEVFFRRGRLLPCLCLQQQARAHTVDFEQLGQQNSGDTASQLATWDPVASSFGHWGGRRLPFAAARGRRFHDPVTHVRSSRNLTVVGVLFLSVSLSLIDSPRTKSQFG